MKPLYKSETEKALRNFPISGKPFSLDIAKNIALIKKFAAITNSDLNLLDTDKSKAISEAAEEIIQEKHNDQIVVDEIQGGAGTSMNMNVNEVVATRASEILGSEVHPIDDVNLSQSTNDVVPTAMKITFLQQLDKLSEAYQLYYDEISNKADQFMDIIKVGRTHVQDAIPISLGQEFHAHASAAKEDIRRLKDAKKSLLIVNIGGTAIGTGMNSSQAYANNIVNGLARETGYKLKKSDDLIYSTQYHDSFMEVSSLLTVLAANIIKFMNDLRLMVSGPNAGFGEISFEPLQKGSSIMPGKVNPVMSEVFTQTAFQAIGNNHAITLTIQAGQLELNVMLPLVAKNLLESLAILTKGVSWFTELGLKSIKVNKKRCQEWFDKSFSIATALVPKIGYDKAAEMVERAIVEEKNLKDILIREKVLNEKEYQEIITDKYLISPKP